MFAFFLCFKWLQSGFLFQFWIVCQTKQGILKNDFFQSVEKTLWHFIEQKNQSICQDNDKEITW